MRDSIFEVFEKMFFIFLEPLDEEKNEYDMQTAIRFEGCLNGEIRVFLSREMAKSMIQNMLGLENDEITMQNMEDCSKEAVNMICGNFLGKLDSTKVFNLSIPTFAKDGLIPSTTACSMNHTTECDQKDSINIDLDESACWMDFDSDDGRVGVVINTIGSM